MITLYDAARCPYCARVRILLAEKSIPYETIEVDLSNRPAFRRGESNNLVQRLRELDVAHLPYGLAAIAYLPWVIRARDRLHVQVPEHVESWLVGVSERAAIRAELELVAAM